MRDVADILKQLVDVEQHVKSAEQRAAGPLAAASDLWRASLRNFVHYLALRQLDIRKLQLELADLGLSSLGRAESYVMGNVSAVRTMLEARVSGAYHQEAQNELTWAQAERLIHAHTRALCGPKPSHRHVYIMVTAPDALTADATWMNESLDTGMNLLRINAAHGHPSEWRTIAATARAAAQAKGATLKIAVDLPGPKLRTVELQPDVRVLHIKPKRDPLGRVIAPARIYIGPTTLPVSDAFDLVSDASASLTLPPELIEQMATGDVLAFKDSGGRKRRIKIRERVSTGYLGTARHSAYITPETKFHLCDKNGSRKRSAQAQNIPATPREIIVGTGDAFLLCRIGASLPPHDPDLPAIGCTADEVFLALRPGMPVLIDDGQIVCTVSATATDHAVLRIEKAARDRIKLRGDMGLNLPETDLMLPSLSPADEEALAFAEQYADIVNLSFVRSLADVTAFEARVQRQDLGLVLKIENRAGFAALPTILLHNLGRRPLGVMIARGDLAVEVGFTRLAEVQEELLWLCEAAHVPVVWATQVLQSLAKTGFPTRAEISDAAMAVGAECVMLNKGPYIHQAVMTLDTILRRMEAHHYKKRSLYRPLHLTLPPGFGGDEPPAVHV
ncbi:MAG: pyruvate kinase [Proteobacteria bacterium]|nr:pyruvate kinase [Pseudomonadota bacterium]